ncbi:MAG TPA: DUF4349 domain-containing protein [Kofleriaceae bacterium]|nr:DUF4349 domain-containing protein [Kofleriaceae bacterium]
MRAFILVVVLVGCGGTYKSAYAPTAAGHVSRLEAKQEPVSWQDIVVTTRHVEGEAEEISEKGAAYASTSTQPPPPATAAATTTAPAGPEGATQSEEKLVVEAWLQMKTSNVGKAVDDIRSRVELSGGHMVSENVQGSGSSASSATLEFRVPPAQATAIASWLGQLGTVTSKNVKSTEVSKTLFDQELALENLGLTMTRLQALAEKGGPIDQVLAIEKEMTRVRGEIERIKGEHRWLVDRVAYATIDVTLEREGDEQYDVIPEARIYPGPQLSTLVLIDPGMHQRTRFGGGASVRVHRLLTFDLSVFPRGDGGESRAVVATIGTALYSAYLGYGQRRYLNPYVGARAGYGYFDGAGGATVAAELGLELYKHEYFLVDSAIRTLAFIREEGNQAAIQGTLGVAVPF